MRPDDMNDTSSKSREYETDIPERIISYCDKINADIDFFGNDRETFMEDDRYQRAVAFCLFQIGEDVKKLRRSFPEIYDTSYWKQIAGARDIIGHGYDGYDIGLMWDSLESDISELKAKCISRIGTTGSD